MRPLRIDPINQVLISNSDANTLTRNEIQTDDVLITRTGANRGECAIYDRDERAIASSHTFIVRPKQLDPQFLAVFLNSHFGKAQIDKGVYGAAQPEVAPYYLRNIWLPAVSSTLISRIKSAFTVSKSIKVQSETKQKEAEDTLLEALGLADWKPPEPLSYSATLTDIMGVKRLDAQFHRPKFKELQAVHENRFELQYLHDVVLKGRTVPYSETGTVPIIRSGDLTDIDIDDAAMLHADASEPIFLLKKGDVLISSIGFGSIGKVQVFDKEGRYSTVSEVTVVRQGKLNPFYIMAYLRSEAGQLQIDRYITGATGQLHLYPRDVEKFFIPILPADKQIEFERIYNSARQLKTLSRQLLEAIKRAVEIAAQLTLAFNRPNYHTVKLHSLPLFVPYQITPVHELLRGSDRPVFLQLFQPPGAAPTPHPSSSSSPRPRPPARPISDPVLP